MDERKRGGYEFPPFDDDELDEVFRRSNKKGCRAETQEEFEEQKESIDDDRRC